MIEINKSLLHRIAYSTDASAYREMPLGVAFPSSEQDIIDLVRYVGVNKQTIIPRAGGTSLAGQVVGSGIVVDISKHLNKIVEINVKEHWAIVQPGVVLDELNLACKPYALCFGPETSTSNRCCLGGMLGNNSCGSHSLVYGSTRHHLLEARVVLSDASVEIFKSYTIAELEQRFGREFWKEWGVCGAGDAACGAAAGASGGAAKDSLIRGIYAWFINLALDSNAVSLIEESYPCKTLRRRNCGYAIDEVIEGLLDEDLDFRARSINLCNVLAGSEGTLAFATELKVNLCAVLPKEKLVLCAHCDVLDKAFLANLVALKFKPVAIELIDSNILELSKGNLAQQKNRFFVKGDPAAILIIELAFDTRDELDTVASALEEALMRQANVVGCGSGDGSSCACESSGDVADIVDCGVNVSGDVVDACGGSNCGVVNASGEGGGALVYYCSRVYGADINKVWALRKAGLGLLSGMKGDAKPVSVIEDTAVAAERLPAYMKDFAQMLKSLGLSCVYHAHIATGELHLRPILNIKDKRDRELFREVALQTALLVKKHRGSLSGEHGDGRLRGEFIRIVYGDSVYELMRSLKACFDVNNVFNCGKIVDTPPMDCCLRYDVDQSYMLGKQGNLLKDTYFNWKAENVNLSGRKSTNGFSDSSLYAFMCCVEQCNGAGDCRKSNSFAGTMCPTFRLTGDEVNSTRARVNVLREILTRGAGDNAGSVFKIKELKEVLDSCLACKACKNECPSNIDMASFRAEVLQHYYDVCGTPFRSFMVARMAMVQRFGSRIAPLYNFFASWSFSQMLLKRMLKFSSNRSIPTLSRYTMRRLVSRELAARGAGVGFSAGASAGFGVASGAVASGAETGVEANGLAGAVTGATKRVLLFADEFTNYSEANLGLTFAKLLMSLGYSVSIPKHCESGRAAISKGCLKLAKKFATKNVRLLSAVVSRELPIVGNEPSCILSFRDEYPLLVDESLRSDALKLAKNCLLYDEFFMRECEKGNISSESFSAEPIEVYLHGHCHQKALVGIEKTEAMLRLLPNAVVHVIPSGCCGMAGSYGYEAEHYKTSVEIGEMVLFPAIRKAVGLGEKKVFVCAPGTSCRQQILDCTGVKAIHPLELMYLMLK